MGYSQSYNLRFANPTLAGGQFTVTVQAEAVGSSFDLGSSNFYFTFNSSALTFSSGNMLNYNTGNYTYSSVGITGNEVSVNVGLNFGTGGDPLPTSWTNLAEIVFNITDETQSSNLVWNVGPCICYDDNYTTIPGNSFQDLDYSLPVELSTFEAELAQNAVMLKWSTASEKNNQGFNLYRSEQENGSYEKLNGSLIPGNGTTTNTNEYEFRDDRIESNKYYYYRLEDVDINGQAKQHGPINIFIDPALMAPTEYSLDQNYPNPFNPGTTISYGLPEDTQVRLQVFNMKGQVVATLVDAFQPAGRYDLRWDASTALNGSSLPTGIYFYKLETSQYTQIKKMIYTK
jgi:hypothetical protein